MILLIIITVIFLGYIISWQLWKITYYESYLKMNKHKWQDDEWHHIEKIIKKPLYKI